MRSLSFHRGYPADSRVFAEARRATGRAAWCRRRSPPRRSRPPPAPSGLKDTLMALLAKAGKFSTSWLVSTSHTFTVRSNEALATRLLSQLNAISGNCGGMSLQNIFALPRLSIPEAHDPVRAGPRHPLVVRTEGHRVDLANVSAGYGKAASFKLPVTASQRHTFSSAPAEASNLPSWLKARA